MIRSFRRQPQATGGNGGNEADFGDGPLVKRLRRGPLTPQTWVRFPHGSPFQITFAKMKRQFHFGEEEPHRSETQRSGFGSERRSNEAIRSFRVPYGNRGNGVSEVCDDEVGVNDDEGPPVPIPNTEVKLVGGDNTCLATDREDSTMPTQRQQLRNRSCCHFYIRRQTSIFR